MEAAEAAALEVAVLEAAAAEAAALEYSLGTFLGRRSAEVLDAAAGQAGADVAVDSSVLRLVFAILFATDGWQPFHLFNSFDT